MTSEEHITVINDIIVNFALTTQQRNAATSAVNRAEENIEWLAYHGGSISQWLTGSVGGDASGITINIGLLFGAITSLMLLFV